jgi:hypothetical protein
MHERIPLFHVEAKTIVVDLLKRTSDLFDLSRHFIEYECIHRVLFERIQQCHRSYPTYRRTCQLNHNLQSDLDAYVHRLSTSCRSTKTNLRSLNAIRLTNSIDCIVLDDDVDRLLKSFNSQFNRLCREFHWSDMSTSMDPIDSIGRRRYQSQRTLHCRSTSDVFTFLPETSISNRNNHSSDTLESMRQIIVDEYRTIFVSFEKISRCYRSIVTKLYGVHLARDSYILQPTVINIIRLLLFITTQLKQRIDMMSTTIITCSDQHRSTWQHAVCHVQEKSIKANHLS